MGLSLDGQGKSLPVYQVKMCWSRWDIGESEHKRIQHKSTEKKKENTEINRVCQAIAYKYKVLVIEFIVYLPHDRSNSGPAQKAAHNINENSTYKMKILQNIQG